MVETLYNEIGGTTGGGERRKKERTYTEVTENTEFTEKKNSGETQDPGTRLRRAWGNLGVEEGTIAIRENGVPGGSRTDLKVGHYKN